MTKDKKNRDVAKKNNSSSIATIVVVLLTITLIVISSLPSFKTQRPTLGVYVDESGEINIPMHLIDMFNEHSQKPFRSKEDMQEFIEQFQLLVYECRIWNMNDELLNQLDMLLNDYEETAYTNGKEEADRNLERMMAEQAHTAVLQENGGEWYSSFQIARVKSILDIILINMGENPNQFIVTLLNNGTYNAFSTADGRIYLNRGLLTSSTNDEIAFVLAHEIHHIITGNWMNWWMESNQFQWDGIDNQYYSGVKELIAAGITTLTPNSVLSYDQEFEADAYALYVATKSGYDPNTMIKAIRNLPNLPVTSHPDVISRVENLEKLIEAIEEPSFINLFNPCKVVLSSFSNMFASKFRRDWGLNDVIDMPGQLRLEKSLSEVNWNVVDEYDYDLGYITIGVSGIQKSFFIMFTNLMNMSQRGGHGIDSLKSPDVEVSKRLVGRSKMITPTLCVVDVGLNTSLGRSTAGEMGKLLGRVWLLKTDDYGWIIIGAGILTGDFTAEINYINDELEFVPASANQPIGQIYILIQEWREAFLGNFLDHIEKYIDVPAAELEILYDINWDIDEQILIEGKFQALVWSWFTINSSRTTMPIWDLQLQLLSRNVATCRFSFLLQSGLIPYYSANAQMVVVRNDDEWKIAEVVIR